MDIYLQNSHSQVWQSCRKHKNISYASKLNLNHSSGRLDIQDITKEGFYAMRQQQRIFLILEDLLRLRASPVRPIIVANFENIKPATPSESFESIGTSEPSECLFEKKKKGHEGSVSFHVILFKKRNRRRRFRKPKRNPIQIWAEGHQEKAGKSFLTLLISFWNWKRWKICWLRNTATARTTRTCLDTWISWKTDSWKSVKSGKKIY